MVSELQVELFQYKNKYFWEIETKWMCLADYESNSLNEIIIELKEDFRNIIENIIFHGHNMNECNDEYCNQCTKNLQDLKAYIPGYKALFNFITGEITLDDLCTFFSNSTLSSYTNLLWDQLPDHLKEEYGYLRTSQPPPQEENSIDEYYS